MSTTRTLVAGVLAVAAATGVAAAPASADPGTAGLEPGLAQAYRTAYEHASAEGVPLSITSGKRSWEQQESMWRDGLARYGSPAEARRWVLPPAESTHVTGEAIDVGPWQGANWLRTNGYRWGLCRTFDNEWWHFELATVPGEACPSTSTDASHR